jgi:glucokinase
MKRLLGIDIGGTKCAVCLGNQDARILGRKEIPTKSGPDAILEELAEEIGKLLEEQGSANAIGIVCGGPLDAEAGVVNSPPNLPGWDGVPVVEFFSRRFGIPAFLKNDANAGAIAEWRYGAGVGSTNLMFCTMGTGFGCGLILGGKLFEGANGNAGELGHVRLTQLGPIGYNKSGSVEGWCSGAGIAQIAKARLETLRASGGYSVLSEEKSLTAHSVAEAAEDGDETALQIYAEVGERLGAALSFAIDMLNLDTIVVGSIFARRENLIRPTMEAVLKRECLEEALAVCRVVPAALGETIGDVAALAVAQLGVEES